MSPKQRFFFAIVLFTLLGALPALAQQCRTDAECNVGKSFCGGEYRCTGGAGADANGCSLRPVTARCGSGQTCNEAAKRCEVTSCANPDADGDGHRSQACGGDDCDDNDPNAFPGNPEVWDANDHDEDCNAETHGVPPQLELVLTEHLQACSGTGVVLISRKLDGNLPLYDHYRTATCTPGTVCIPQPSGEGVCGAKPENYEVPPVIANIPTGPQQHARNTAPSPQQRATPPTLNRPNGTFNPTPSMRQLGPPNRTQVCPKGQKWDPVTSSCK